MKLWLVELSELVGYDTYNAFVVRAEDIEGARFIASENSAGEGSDIWLDYNRSECKEIGVASPSAGTKEPSLILGSFHAG